MSHSRRENKSTATNHWLQYGSYNPRYTPPPNYNPYTSPFANSSNPYMNAYATPYSHAYYSPYGTSTDRKRSGGRQKDAKDGDNGGDSFITTILNKITPTKLVLLLTAIVMAVILFIKGSLHQHKKEYDRRMRSVQKRSAAVAKNYVNTAAGSNDGYLHMERGVREIFVNLSTPALTTSHNQPLQLPESFIRTIATLFEHAQSPNLLKVGVVYYCADSDVCNSHIVHECPLLKQYRSYCDKNELVSYVSNIKCHHEHSYYNKGTAPTRYIAMSKLYDGEYYMLLLDSDVLVVKGWDGVLVSQHNNATLQQQAEKNNSTYYNQQTASSVNTSTSGVIITCRPPSALHVENQMRAMRSTHLRTAMAEKQRQDDLLGASSSSSFSKRNHFESTRNMGEKLVIPFGPLRFNLGTAASSHYSDQQNGGFWGKLISFVRGAPYRDSKYHSYTFALEVPHVVPGVWCRPVKWTKKRSIPRPVFAENAQFYQTNILDSTTMLSKTSWYCSSVAFGEASTFMSIPDDPRLIDISGENGLDYIQGIRLWTNGIEFYNPPHLVAIKQPLLSSTTSRRKKRITSVKLMPSTWELLRRYFYQLATEQSSSSSSSTSYNRQKPQLQKMRWYMFGSNRSLQQYIDFSGYDWYSNRISNYTLVGVVMQTTMGEMEQECFRKYGQISPPDPSTINMEDPAILHDDNDANNSHVIEDEEETLSFYHHIMPNVQLEEVFPT